MVWRDPRNVQTGHTPVTVLVGNKIDLASKRVVDAATATHLAEELGIPYVETSAKTSEGVEHVFMLLTRKILSHCHCHRIVTLGEVGVGKLSLRERFAKDWAGDAR